MNTSLVYLLRGLADEAKLGFQISLLGNFAKECGYCITEATINTMDNITALNPAVCAGFRL